ncbi:MAG: PorT family protein [Chitinispirillia bacterium]|nr:PorT family protein [Chitinispirillia bacterium]
MKKTITSLMTALSILLCFAIPVLAQDAEQPVEAAAAAEEVPAEAETEVEAEAAKSPDTSEPESEDIAAAEPEAEAESEVAAVEPEVEAEPQIEPEPEVAAVETKADQQPYPVVTAVPVKEKVKPVYSKLMLGARFAYNNSSAKNLTLEIESRDDLYDLQITEYRHNSRKSHGFEVQAAVIYNLTDWFAVNAAPGLAFRNPFVTDVACSREFALTLPVLLDFRMFETQFHLLSGVQLDIPFASKIKWNNGPSFDFDDRGSIDFGVVLGFVIYLRENYFWDFKYNIGLTNFAEYEGKKDSRMNQLSVGVGTILQSR